MISGRQVNPIGRPIAASEVQQEQIAKHHKRGKSPRWIAKGDVAVAAHGDHCPRKFRADSGHSPAWRKKFVHSWGLNRNKPGMVCSAALRRCAFNLLKVISIGLRSGE